MQAWCYIELIRPHLVQGHYPHRHFVQFCVVCNSGLVLRFRKADGCARSQLAVGRIDCLVGAPQQLISTHFFAQACALYIVLYGVLEARQVEQAAMLNLQLPDVFDGVKAGCIYQGDATHREYQHRARGHPLYRIN